MAIKLYNKTRCPDGILRRLVTAAARRIGARTGVVVKITQRRGPVCRYAGFAHQGWPYLWHLTRKQKGIQRNKIVETDCGWIELRLPFLHRAYDHLVQAEEFYRLCLHEWAHIKDYQKAGFLEWSKKGRHRNRPQERRAYRMEKEAQERYYSPTAEQAILDLALWLEAEANAN